MKNRIETYLGFCVKARKIVFGAEEAEKQNNSDVPLTVFGPFEASVYKINEKYRMQFVIKCRNNKNTRLLFSRLYAVCEKKFNGKIQITFDMNSNNI